MSTATIEVEATATEVAESPPQVQDLVASVQTAASNVIATSAWDRIDDPMRFAAQVGTAICQSGLFGVKSTAAGQVLALACVLERRNPFDLIRTYHIIDNKLSMRADAMLAEFHRRGGKTKWMDLGDDGQEARAQFEWDRQKLEVAFTIADAQRAELCRKGSNWEKNPGAMLRARLISKAVRILAPGIVAGCYTPEELTDGVPDEGTPDRVTVAAETVEVELPTAAQAVATRQATATSAPAAPAASPKRPVASKPVAAAPATPAQAPVATQAASPPASPLPFSPAPTQAAAPAQASDLDVDTAAAEVAGPPMCTESQYREIGSLVKDQLKIPAFDFRSKILAKRLHWQTGEPVTTTKHLTADQAQALIVSLREGLKRQELQAWANGTTAPAAAVPATAAAEANGRP